MLVHLNTHSTFSKMRGTATPQELLARAKAHGQQYLALTEVNGLWGFIRFVQFAKEADIKPIAGTNIISVGDDIVLLAESRQGYENMCRIISAVHDNDERSATDLLKKWHTGLFVLTHQEALLEKLSRFIPETHLFVELRPGVTERHAWRLSRLFNLEIVATGDVYFLDPADQKTHKILRAIDNNETLSQLNPAEYKSNRHFFRSEKEKNKCLKK